MTTTKRLAPQDKGRKARETSYASLRRLIEGYHLDTVTRFKEQHDVLELIRADLADGSFLGEKRGEELAAVKARVDALEPKVEALATTVQMLKDARPEGA